MAASSNQKSSWPEVKVPTFVVPGSTEVAAQMAVETYKGITLKKIFEEFAKSAEKIDALKPSIGNGVFDETEEEEV